MTAMCTADQSSARAIMQLNDVICQKQTEFERTRWCVLLGGHKLVLKEIADNVLRGLQKFEKIGDLAIGIDPGHAALPWIIIRGCLETVLAERNLMAALLAGTETITFVIGRCRVYEIFLSASSHNDLTHEARQSLENNIVKLYEEILRFLGAAVKLLDSSIVSRTVEAVFETNDVSGFCSRCITLENKAQIAFENLNILQCQQWQKNLGQKATKLQETLSDMQAPLFRIHEKVSVMFENISGTERSNVLQWISKVEYDDNHSSAKEGRVSDTGDWLLCHQQYKAWWNANTSATLWLHGIREQALPQPFVTYV
ncbi:MAG: hypothetical protein Q9227_004919 [Pyrenula ochraceoflavens]